jgi:hypothetical protein
LHRQPERVGAGGAGDGFGDAEVLGNFALEGGGFVAKNKLLRFADPRDGGFHLGANGRVLPLEVEDRDGSFGDALGGRITQLIVRIEKPILAFRWSVADVDGWRVWPATGHGRLPAFQLSLKLLEVDSAERSGELGQVGATLFQHRLGADEVSG